MKRIRILLNGDVHKGIPHFHSKIWDDGEMLGEVIVLRNGIPVVIPLEKIPYALVKAIQDDIEKIKLPLLDGELTSSDLVVEITNDISGIFGIKNFLGSSEYSELRSKIFQIIKLADGNR